MSMTPQTIAATLALFDGDADEATVVARIVALRQGKRQDWERNRAVARVSLPWPLPDGAYAACSTAHTSPHRSTKSRRRSAKDTVSFRCWR